MIYELSDHGIALFRKFGQQIPQFGYTLEQGYELHGVLHILRVLYLTLLTFENSKEPFTQTEKDILVYYVLLHDIGRTHDGIDAEHGRASVQTIKKNQIEVDGVRFSETQQLVAWFIIDFHCRADQDGFSYIQNHPMLSASEKERARLLYCTGKDMDGLDRLRINDLDVSMLRTEFSRQLPETAKSLLSKDLLSLSGLNNLSYHTDSCTVNDQY